MIVIYYTFFLNSDSYTKNMVSFAVGVATFMLKLPLSNVLSTHLLSWIVCFHMIIFLQKKYQKLSAGKNAATVSQLNVSTHVTNN